MEIKNIDNKTTEFTANGKTYRFQPLTIGRFKEFRKMERHFGWGVTYEQDVKDMQKAMQYLNKTEWVNAAVLLNKRLERIQHFEDNQHDIALLICTLFLNTADEDITTWNGALADTKIADWNAEGYSATSFFWLAATIVPGYITNLNEISLSILASLQTEMK